MMPIQRCTKDGKDGWQYGNNTCYTSKDGKKKAYLQKYAIEQSEKKAGKSTASDKLKLKILQEQLKAATLSPEFAKLADELIVAAEGTAKAGLPKAPKDHPWDAAAARKRIASWAGGPSKKTIDWGKYGKAFLIKQGDGKSFGDYKCPIADVIDGKLMVVYDACKAALSVLDGGRGGVSGEGVASARKRVVSYLRGFGDKDAGKKK